jgi:dTDP-4-dehydrorhamnose reductase
VLTLSSFTEINQEKMKVALLGASGLVGRSLRAFLEQDNIPWIGTYNTSPFEGGVAIDLSNKETIYSFFKTHNITHCINCIAERNVDLCEKQVDKTMETNCWFAKRLAEICSKQNIYYLHVSTDYVFDGSSPPYSPDSLYNPLQIYGKSKMKAEEEIKHVNETACIVRVPVLYTQRYKTILETAVTMIGKKVMDTTKEYVEDDYFPRRPVFIDDFAVFLISCLYSEKRGIYHFYNTKDKVTKYTIAKMIATYLGKSWNHIQPQSKPLSVAGRPYDTQLIDAQYSRSNYPDTELKDGIQHCFQRFAHPTFYNHTNPSSPIFYMMDLDGTIVDTDYLHYEAYKKTFQIYGYELCDWNEYRLLPSIEEYCKQIFQDKYAEIKEYKQRLLLQESQIDFMPGAESFLRWIIDTNQNIVIVTNTTRQTVDFFQSKLPLLREIHQWVTREDVTNPKPNDEPYKLAKERYYKGEQYCIGFENTVSGFTSLSTVAPIIYIVCKNDSDVYRNLYKEDVYFIPDFTNIFSKPT